MLFRSYFLPMGLLLHEGGMVAAGVDASTLNWSGFIANLLPVTLGNIVGGSVMVALVYYLVHGRAAKN